mgnify:CR=1 FL=1
MVQKKSLNISFDKCFWPIEARECEPKSKQKMSSLILEEINFLQDRFCPDVEFYGWKK